MIRNYSTKHSSDLPMASVLLEVLSISLLQKFLSELSSDGVFRLQTEKTTRLLMNVIL